MPRVLVAGEVNFASGGQTAIVELQVVGSAAAPTKPPTSAEILAMVTRGEIEVHPSKIPLSKQAACAAVCAAQKKAKLPAPFGLAGSWSQACWDYMRKDLAKERLVRVPPALRLALGMPLVPGASPLALPTPAAPALRLALGMPLVPGASPLALPTPAASGADLLALPGPAASAMEVAEGDDGKEKSEGGEKSDSDSDSGDGGQEDTRVGTAIDTINKHL